jgi:hypothetical protein
MSPSLSPLAPPLLVFLSQARALKRPDGTCDTLSLLKQAYRLRAALAPDLQPDWDALISDILAEACRDPEDEAAPEPAA